MEKIDAASMKEKTEIAIEKRENRLSHILEWIDEEAHKGKYSYFIGSLTESQKKQLKELGYELTHDTGNGWIISWDHPTNK